MPDFSSVQIPKLLDWQAFQRACVPLFRKILGDPTLTEFGRGGQDQQGIDLHGYRSGDLSKPVGVQTRNVEKLEFKAIQKAVGKARNIKPALTEIIFATAAKHDAELQRKAMQFTAELVQAGWSCRITIMGWEALQLEIAACPEALQHFLPVLPTAPPKRDTDELLAAIKAQGDRTAEAIAISRSTPLAPSLDPRMPEEALSERRDVHEKISVYRDLISDGKTETAIAQLVKMRMSISDLQPFARFRIETNIGAADFRAGRPDKALASWRSAMEIRPDDPKARANVALGIYATGDPAGALALAKSILADHPAQPGALAVLLQTSGPDTDPFELAPEASREDADVLASTIAVLRKRDDKRWYVAAREAETKHPDDLRFRQWAAEATLEPILADSALLIGKSPEDGAMDAVEGAANALLSVWEKACGDEAVDEETFAALAQNCAVALRYCQRVDEAVTVIDRALLRFEHNAALVRIRARLHLEANEDDQAVRILGDSPNDSELELLRAEALAQKNPSAAAAVIDGIVLTDLPDVSARAATKLRLELALDLGDLPRAEALARDLELLGEARPGLMLVWARIEQKKSPRTPTIHQDEKGDDLDDALLPANAVALAQCLQFDDVDFSTRVSGAQLLDSLGAHDAASNALHGRVDISRDTVALRTYLGASVSAGLIVRSRDALAALPATVASLPFYKRVSATLFWNTGDARAAATIIADLFRLDPQRLDLLLWHIDCLVRLGQEEEVRKLLASVNHEDLNGSLSAKLRLARALVAFGLYERALSFAYQLFLTNRDTSEVWMTLVSVVFGLPSNGGPDLLRESADDQAVIEIRTNRGEIRRYSVESDEKLRRYTTDAIDVVHPVALAVRGLRPGDNIDLPDGGTASIITVKNKYLDAFQTALNRYNDRFPSANGLRRVRVDSDSLGGLNEMKGVLSARSRHVTEQAKQYAEGRTFLGGLALATGVDPVEAMLGLSEVGVPFRVAHGLRGEREAALKGIEENAKSGCIIDGPTLHTVRRLSLESVVAAICGPIGVTQMTLDSLSKRLHSLDERRAQPAGSLSYVNGQLQMRETPPEAIEDARNALRSDIEWIASNAEVLSAVPKVDPPRVMRDMNRLAGTKLFDDIFAANGGGRLFVVDDLMTRHLASEMGVRATWLQPVLMAAKELGILNVADYARVLSDLSEIGEEFLSVDGEVLLAAYRLDCNTAAHAPGRRLRGVMRCVGGATADAASHATAVAEFLIALWRDPSLAQQRQPATSAALRQLLRERTRDWQQILLYLERKFEADRSLAVYLRGWEFGHFLNPHRSDA